MPITTEQINTELSAIVAALAQAADSRDKGITLDLTPITIQATALCEHIINLPPDDAMRILPDLQHTVNALNDIHAGVKNS
jgi:hypothetical protein